MTHAQDDITQAFAAFFATLITAIAQLAAEQPLLAPSLRMSIRQIEKIAKQFQALATEWQATRHRPKLRGTGVSASRACNHSDSEHTQQRRESTPAPRRRAAMRNPATAPRAPPGPAHA